MVRVPIISDVGSGVNKNNKGFLKLLNMIPKGKSQNIVAYKDGLTRFGFETLRRLFSS